MRGQHFPRECRLCIPSFPWFASEEGIEIVKIVARDQDGFTFARVQSNFRRLRMAKGLSVGLVQNLHDTVVQFADRKRGG